MSLLVATPIATQQADPEKLAVLRAVLTYIDVDAEDAVQAGSALDPAAAVALKSLTANRPPEIIGVTRRNRVVVETLTVTGQTAEVHFTSRTVAPSHPLACGQTFTMPLRRTSSWQVVQDNTRVRCTDRPATTLDAADARLLEAARLAVSTITLKPDVRLTADAHLSANALRVLKTAIEMPAAAQFETSAYLVPENHFVIHRLELQQDIVTFVGTLGSVPRAATLACGSTYTVELRQKSDGWVFGNLHVMGC